MSADLNYIDVASLEELAPGHTLKISTTIGDILLANVDDKIYAVDDMCTHEDSSLSLGCLKDELVSCTLHGSRFNVRTGQPMEEPATETSASISRTYTKWPDRNLPVCHEITIVVTADYNFPKPCKRYALKSCA